MKAHVSLGILGIERHKVGIGIQAAGAANALVPGWGRNGYRLVTYFGVLSGAVALIKVGEGMLNIDQENSYTGGMQIRGRDAESIRLVAAGEEFLSIRRGFYHAVLLGRWGHLYHTGDSYTNEVVDIWLSFALFHSLLLP